VRGLRRRGVEGVGDVGELEDRVATSPESLTLRKRNQCLFRTALWKNSAIHGLVWRCLMTAVFSASRIRRNP
jgi:hypothetical protein